MIDNLHVERNKDDVLSRVKSRCLNNMNNPRMQFADNNFISRSSSYFCEIRI